MASAFKKSGDRWFVRYKLASGKWVSRRTEQVNRRDALRAARKLAADEEKVRLGLEAAPASRKPCGELMRQWSRGLVNRAASDDRSRLENHVIPRFGSLPIAALNLAAVMAFIDDARETNTPTAPTLRHCLTILSRFFGWCIARGFATVNPLRSLPSSKRPAAAGKKADAPWIKDDATVRELVRLLPEQIGAMFLIGNRCGLRTGEVCGLRLSDVADVAAGSIRVRFSYAGPLKEDRRCEGKSKWAPAGADVASTLAPLIAKRLAEGAGPEDFLFVREGRHFRKEHLQHPWRRACSTLGLDLSWYAGTRHSFASRNLSHGVALDEVASALGHSTPAITARHYAHFVRRTFSPAMTAPMGPALRLVSTGDVDAQNDGPVSRLNTEGEHAA
jgi:integrase